MNVYEQAEALLRARLVTAAGKVRRNAEACVALGLWLLRRHGPHGAGRQFWVPRLELARNWRFQDQVGLTASQIRTARDVLVEVGLLTLIEPGERGEGDAKHAPNVFAIGPEFALLFPKTLGVKAEVATKTPGKPGIPLFVATCGRLPVGRPVIMTLKSSDVIHTFWLPSLHGKKDMIPGRTSLIRLRADRAGTYRGQCAEFCGMEHAMMAFLVTAEDNDRYEAWADAQRREASNVLDAQQSRGRQVFMERSCVMCHTVQGIGANAVFGPDLTHVASRRTLASGVLPNNRQQLAAWITQPQKLKPGTNMPATALSQEELDSLLAFIDTLK